MRTQSHQIGPSWAGSILLGNTYLLGRLISRGGMSEIFEATHARLPGRFAVKILAPDLLGNREAFARFCREAEIMSELRHPNVVQIFDFNTAPDERPYFVMEYLEGRDLQTRLDESDPPTLSATVRLVEAVASALEAAHAHGIVHRDLKPANIFLVAVDGQPDELVKVLDFGISKVRKIKTLLSVPTEILGSPPYMAPEQVRGATSQIDGRTDQFALGAIAYRMLTGRDAFTGEVSAVLYQIVHEAPPPLRYHLPTSWDTRPLQAVLDRALAKDPAGRWGGMMEFARALEAAADRVLSVGPREEQVPGAFEAAPVVDTVPAVRPPELVQSEHEPMPIAVVRVARTAALDPPLADHDFLDAELPDTLDRIPVTHHRGAVVGTVALALAGLLIATGWYRRIPAMVPPARQQLAVWLHPKPVARAESISRPLSPAPAPPAPSAVAVQSAPPPPPDPSAEPHTEAATPPQPSEVPATGGEKPTAAGLEGHHHARPTTPRFRGHPGSIELAPPAEAEGQPTAPPETEGFPIAPPAALADTPAHALVPDEPESPPPARSASSPSSSDAPSAPSKP